MSKENEITKVTGTELLFLEKELSPTKKPLTLSEMTKKLVYQKTSDQLIQEVKKYDAGCQYEAGDFIYKDYDEPLMVSSKGVEHFKGAVVLKVLRRVPFKEFNCDMLEVDYSGGGVFRKYMDYMKKTKTQVLLPANCEGKAMPPEKMEKKEDPRLTELPMTDRDLKTLERNLEAALFKSAKFFNWNEYWQLAEKRVEIQDEKVKDIENHITETQSSASTAELAGKFFNVHSSDEAFDLFCMSLNFCLEKKFKKDFVYVSPLEWGKWHLKKVLNSLSLNSPLSAPKAALPALAETEKGETAQIQNFPLKHYLTWREILSGGLKIPRSLNKELSSSKEYMFTDIEEGKDYTVYYYPTLGFFLGLKDFYQNHNVLQGASLTLERKGLTEFHFWLKKSKKKLSFMKIAYSPEDDKFARTDDEVFTFCLPNKIIHIEKNTLDGLISLYPQRDNLNLTDLLVLVYKNFGLESEGFSLHYLRAYHLVDILKQTTQEDIEKTLLGSPEFIASDKKKGTFFYREKMKREEEVEAELPPEIGAEFPVEEEIKEVPVSVSAAETPAGEGVAGMIEGREGVRGEARFEAPQAAVEGIIEREKPTARKEKPPRKKKARMEGERDLRARKGAKKIIEEKIELEESEQEAQIAVKAKEKKEAEEEARPKEKKPEGKPLVSKEPVFGLFAEKLKSALNKKKKQEKK